ncbi:PspA/IM30 family protein [Oceanithermus desulfurans]
MKTAILIPVLGAGAALVWYGLTQADPEIKRTQTLGAPPVDPGLIPTHTKSGGEQSTTYAQLLTAYEAELQKWQTVHDAAADRMDSIEAKAAQVCPEFAWNATWSYKYGGLLGSAGWTELRKSSPRALQTSCMDYVMGLADSPGKPSIKPPPREGANFMDTSWLNVAQAIRQLQLQVEDARATLDALRADYAKAKAERDAAVPKIEEMKRKIADLHAQEVF